MQDIILFDEGHNIFMIQNKNHQNYISQYPRTTQNHLFKQHSPKSTEIHLNKAIPSEKTLTFRFTHYPFRNQTKSEFKFYKTLLNTPISQEQLKNLVSISHSNMIKIQKISKGGVKYLQGIGGQVYYSIYYEIITYSLKQIANSGRKYNTLLPHLTSLYLCQQLLSVMQYLIKENINYQLQLDDIGVTDTGHVKVYISPLLLVDSNRQTVNRKKALDSIDDILQWWKNTSSMTINNEAQNYTQQFSKLLYQAKQTDVPTANQIRTNSTSFIQKQAQESRYVGQNIEGNLMHKSQTHQNNNGHSNYEKMKKLDKEIKNIRQTLKQRAKIRKQKEREDNILKNSKEMEMTKMAEVKIEEPKVQNIQQNINCINIFHTPVSLAWDEVANFHKNSKMIHANNKMAITRDKKQVGDLTKQNIVVAYNNLIPDDLYHEEDNLSVDTYDMDMGLDFQTTGNTKNKIPFTNRQREKSQCNYRAKREQNNKIKQGINQVVNKSVTVSAGPKQFKNFVVNFVKPQFMAKRSNIYEDPGEYQSQNSKSISNKFSIHYKELNEAGKSVTSHTEKSSSLAKQSAHKLQNKIVINQQIKNNQNPNTTYMKKARILNTESNEIVPQNRFIKPQRSETIIGTKKLQDLEIGKKVIQALQKTKQAIAILKKVRLGNKKTAS